MAQVAAISQQIWDMKYRLKGPDGAPLDKTIEDSWRRVAAALAEAEEPGTQAQWAEAFYEALSGFKYLPAGRILAGAGAKRNVTLFNCFVMGTIPDDMSGIFEHLREAALTMQQGGGIGYDFSTLRPRRAPAHVQPVGARHRRLHDRDPRGRALGADLRRRHLQGRGGARAVGQDHARDLRLCRAGRDLHRPRQPPQQPVLLRDDRRHQSLHHRRK